MTARDLPQRVRARLADARTPGEVADILGAELVPGRPGRVPWTVAGADRGPYWVLRRWVRQPSVDEQDHVARYGLRYRDQRAVPEPIETAYRVHGLVAGWVGERLADHPSVRAGLMRVVIIRAPKESPDASR